MPAISRKKDRRFDHFLGKFKNKTAVKHECSRVLKNSAQTNTVTDPDSVSLLKALLPFHYNSVELLAEPIVGFVSGESETHPGSFCFKIVYRSGRQREFSYNKCFKVMSVKDRQTRAARAAIQEQIWSFKNNTLKHSGSMETSCGICGQTITDAVQIHIDHTITFKQLWSEFQKSNGAPDTVRVQNMKDYVFVDREYTELWQLYHRKEAVLRAVHKQCNLKRKH